MSRFFALFVLAFLATNACGKLLGLPYKRIYASSGSAPTRQLYLNNKGQIVRAKDPDGVQWLFQYDTRGRLEYEVLDVDRNGVIDFAGSEQ